jgi:hypothetical protein
LKSEFLSIRWPTAAKNGNFRLAGNYHEQDKSFYGSEGLGFESLRVRQS